MPNLSKPVNQGFLRTPKVNYSTTLAHQLSRLTLLDNQNLKGAAS